MNGTEIRKLNTSFFIQTTAFAIITNMLLQVLNLLTDPNIPMQGYRLIF